MRRWVGLGLVAGAIFHPSAARSQVVRPDSVKVKVPVPPHADSLIRRDSTGVPRNVPPPQPSDTVQAPITHAAVPRLLSSDRALRFDRAEIFATGALTLQDLLARVQIATPVSAGYVSAPSNIAVAGDFRRTRVFIDGIEYDALDARANGVVDYSQIPVWAAEDITIEQTATEVRVHLRTWRVDRTSPYTRTDIGTGDQQLNVYRGFFGRRFGGGQAIQVAAQQYSTTPPSFLGATADQLGIIGRLGWAGKQYSIDGFASRVGRHRGNVLAFQRADSIPGVESTRTDAYLRLGFHDVDTSAAWAQVVVSRGSYKFTPSTTTASTSTSPTAVDSIPRDTTDTQMQYLAAAGVNRGALRLSLNARIRRGDSTTLVTPAVSGSYALGGLILRGNLEGKSADSLSRSDVAAEFTLGTLLRGGGALDRTVDHRSPADTGVSTGMRSWGGLRIASVWIDAGVIRRGVTTLVAPSVFGASRSILEGAVTGATLRASGRVWKSLFVDANALRWNDTAAVYRPKYQTRSELFVRTNLPDRFPQGNFGLLVSARHEYRSASLMPSGSSGFLRAPGERAISTLLEIRIYSAVVSWQLRDLLGTRNYEAPNYQLPRTANFYGVRWEFWN